MSVYIGRKPDATYGAAAQNGRGSVSMACWINTKGTRRGGAVAGDRGADGGGVGKLYLQKSYHDSHDERPQEHRAHEARMQQAD